jgi:hypothetical protein
MTITRTRTTIASALAVMGFATALPAVSQAKPHKRIHSGARTNGPSATPVTTVAVQRIGVVKTISVPIHAAPPAETANLKAGSAGIPGYGEGTCEGLAADYNKAVDETEQGLLAGDDERTSTYGELANRIYGQLSDNCMVYW